MSNWYRDIINLMENAEGKTKYLVVDNDFNQANYKDLIGKTFDRPPGYAAVKPIKADELEEATAPVEAEPCIPRIAVYNEEGHRQYEAILFFPAADANLGHIVCYAHMGQHSEASMDFFQRHTYRITPANLVKAGLTQKDFDDLIREWEHLGPDNEKVKLYNRDQQSFRDMRWHANVRGRPMGEEAMSEEEIDEGVGEKVYRNRPDVSELRSGEPRVICCLLRTDTPFLTWAGDEYSTPATEENTRKRYAIIGTPYGYMHNSMGDIRFWGSRSGAAKFLRAYKEAGMF